MSETFFRAFTLRCQADVDRAKGLLDQAWKSFAEADDPLRLEIAPESSAVSEEHIRYYRGYVLKPIAEQVWVDGRQYAPKVWHEELLELFAPRVDRVHGSVPKRTNDMSKRDFTKFVQDIEVAFAHAPYFVQFPDRSEPPPWLAKKQP